MIARKLFFPLLFFILLHVPKVAHSKLQKAFIDLNTTAFTKKGFIPLKGEWIFYWNKLLSPQDLKNNELLQSGTFFKAPGHWTDKRNGSLPRFGYGTFILNVKGAPKETELTLTLKDISSSFQVFIAQRDEVKSLGGKGKVGPKKEDSIPEYGQFVKSFKVKDSSFTIFIHLANFHHKKGGLNKLPRLGLKTKIQNQLKTENYQFFFFLFLFLIICVNHFIIFFQRREDKESLWFALFCFLLMVRTLSLESLYESIFFSAPSTLAFNVNYKIRYMTFILSAPVFINFLKYLFTDHIHTPVLKWLWRTTLVGVLIIILTPVHIFTEIQDFFQIVLILSVIYLLTQITRATIQKTPFAKICLLGIFLLGIGVVWDIIVARNDLSHFTTSIFIFIQSYIISKKFSLAFGLVEKLNVELEEKVKERTKEISTLLNNLESSIFSVTKDLQVVTPFSQYSYTLFKRDIEGLNVFDFLFIPIEKGSRRYEEMSGYFEAVFGDDELNYSFIEANFLQNIVLSDSERPEGRSLKISYTPLYDHNGLVQRLMFIVEDITEFEKFYSEAKNDQLSYNFIKEVLTIENKKQLVNALSSSIQSGIQSLSDLLTEKKDSVQNDYFLKSYKKTIEKIIKDVELMPLLNERIHIKTADFDYTSLLGEKEYGRKELEDNLNYQIEVTDKINDVVEYLVVYGNVVKLFYPVKFDMPFDKIIKDKVHNLNKSLNSIFEKAFQVKNTSEINKETLARISQQAKNHEGFDQFMALVQQKTKFISLLLKACNKNEASKTFSALANLFKQMPPQEKLNETDLNQKLIIPFKEMKKLHLDTAELS